MAEKNTLSAIERGGDLDRSGHSHKEPSCVHTKKIYDACRDKDCVEDARVYLTRRGQQVLDRAITVKCRNASCIWVFVDVEPVSFNRGFYTVDVKYYYRVTADAFAGVSRPTEIEGLCTFDKRVILFGSEGNAKIYSSNYAAGQPDSQALRQANLPTAVVEVVDPIFLNVKMTEKCGCDRGEERFEMPEFISGFFDDELVIDGEEKRLFATLGQFSLIRMERDSQLLIDSVEFCMPEKESPGGDDDAPCDLFRRIRFPVDEFFPPDRVHGEFGPGKGDCK